MKKLTIVDHFCGAGGESTGIMQAIESLGLKCELHAHNHWETAIETHSANHPDAIHRCAKIENLDPVGCIPGQRVGLMWASPECTHHSVARGGKPRSDQSRASAWTILKWLSDLYVDRLIVENVPEFLSWGPLGVNGDPLRSRRGETFTAWVKAIKALGYKVEWRILNAADFGDPTTRRRLFIQAVRGRKRILWPEPTHTSQPDLFGSKPWIPARNIIDWSIDSPSILDRKKPLAEATLARIEAGIKKYWGPWAEPFLCVLRGTGTAVSINDPLPTVTAGGNHFGLVEPFITQSEHNGRIHKVDRPIPTITCSSRGYGLVEPFITRYHGGDPNRNHSIKEPLPVVDCSNRFGLVEPLFVPQHGGGSVKAVSEPLSTVATKGAISLVQPFILTSGHRSSIRIRSANEPLSTIVTKAEHCLIEPFLLKYYATAKTCSINDPVPAITTRDRFALIQGTVSLDIHFRMLQPHELAAAQGFPKEYWFAGNKTDQVCQIGNAVPVNTARELAMVALSEERIPT